MSSGKITFQFLASVAPEYQVKGVEAYDSVEVSEVEFNRIKDFGYAIEVLKVEKEKPKAKKSKKKGDK